MSTIDGDKVTVNGPLGTLTFNDAATIGFWFPGTRQMGCDLLDGWRQVGLNVISVPRGVGDGNYTASKFPTLARNITIGGWAMAPDRGSMDYLFDQLVADCFPVDTDLTITRFEPIPKYVVCRVTDPPDIIQYFADECAFRWEATLICSDPFKYDALNVLSGSSGIAGISSGGRTYPRVYPLTYTVVGAGQGNQIVLFNLGSAKAYPYITINGPVPRGWRVDLTTTGESLAFDIDLGASDQMIIDTQNKTAYFNGFPINGLIQGDWFQLVRGSNTIKLFADWNATASFSVTARSTWR
jgi:hypothetical protein